MTASLLLLNIMITVMMRMMMMMMMMMNACVIRLSHGTLAEAMEWLFSWVSWHILRNVSLIADE